jgi:uncharacterized iron-regulated protein
VALLDADLDTQLRTEFAATRAVAKKVVDHAETIEPFDRMILTENSAGRALLNEWIAVLKAQTESLEAIRLRISELAAIR